MKRIAADINHPRKPYYGPCVNAAIASTFVDLKSRTNEDRKFSFLYTGFLCENYCNM